MPRVTIRVELRGSSVLGVSPTGAHSGYPEMSQNESKKPLHALGKELEGTGFGWTRVSYGIQ